MLKLSSSWSSTTVSERVRRPTTASTFSRRGGSSRESGVGHVGRPSRSGLRPPRFIGGPFRVPRRAALADARWAALGARRPESSSPAATERCSRRRPVRLGAWARPVASPRYDVAGAAVGPREAERWHRAARQHLRHGVEQRAHALARGRGDGEHRNPPRGQRSPERRQPLPRLGEIHLRGRDQLRLGGQLRAVPRQLGVEHLVVAQRRPVLARRSEVHQVHQHPAALDVAEELVAEPRALARRPRSARGCRPSRTTVPSLYGTTPRFGTSVVNG